MWLSSPGDCELLASSDKRFFAFPRVVLDGVALVFDRAGDLVDLRVAGDFADELFDFAICFERKKKNFFSISILTLASTLRALVITVFLKGIKINIPCDGGIEIYRLGPYVTRSNFFLSLTS
jgi:hypothetical protein